MGWTQPVCDPCWIFREGDRLPVRVRDADAVHCCNCGGRTRSGIYVRIDPGTIRFPVKEEDD